MSSYTHRMLIAAPLAIIDLANAIGRALDPDVGGDKSFDSVQAGPDAATPTHAICDVIVTTELAAQAEQMLGNPTVLAYAVAQDYAARWPDLTPPGAEDCAAFIAQSKVVIEGRNRTLESVLADHALVLAKAPD